MKPTFQAHPQATQPFLGHDALLPTPHFIHRETWLPYPVEQVFDFFADAHNLEAITPPRLKFHILTPGPIKVQTGTLIEYRLKLYGLPLHWRTRIENWNPPYEFVDTQLSGPYKVWRHLHRFHAETRKGVDGTLMIDHVDYQLPFGPLGRLTQALWVGRDVEGIFTYRESAIRKFFPDR
jgi:ligand-binding SRPBCC domain-containing protein